MEDGMKKLENREFGESLKWEVEADLTLKVCVQVDVGTFVEDAGFAVGEE